jgi:hypothetical protein
MASQSTSPVFPASSLPQTPIPIPPRLELPNLRIEDGELPTGTMSPRTAYNILMGAARDSPIEYRFLLAQQAADGALRKLGTADRTRDDYLRQIADLAAANEAEVQRHAKVEADLRDSFTDLAATSDAAAAQHAEEMDEASRNLADSDRARNCVPDCPDGFEENHGRVSDFIVHYDNGQSAQVPFIRRIPGTSRVAGTFRDPEEPIYVHELYAQAQISPDTISDSLPHWFVPLLERKDSVFATVALEATKLDDWGLIADIERYHDLAARVQRYSDQLHRLQAKETEALHDARSCLFRLARADAGGRLAYLEGLDMGHQQGYPKGRPTPFSSRRRGKGQSQPFA